MSQFKKIKYEVRASYIDQELSNIGFNNLLNHIHEINNVIDYRSGNLILHGEQEYNSIDQNFLFISSDKDILITLNDKHQFLVSEFIYSQKSQKFSFSLRSANATTSPCKCNVHFCHGQCL